MTELSSFRLVTSGVRMSWLTKSMLNEVYEGRQGRVCALLKPLTPVHAQVTSPKRVSCPHAKS
jgi:hypothetical protein